MQGELEARHRTEKIDEIEVSEGMRRLRFYHSHERYSGTLFCNFCDRVILAAYVKLSIGQGKFYKLSVCYCPECERKPNVLRWAGRKSSPLPIFMVK